jgi:hypothetical protein
MEMRKFAWGIGGFGLSVHQNWWDGPLLGRATFVHLGDLESRWTAVHLSRQGRIMTQRMAREIRIQAYRDYRLGKINYDEVQLIVAWTKK